MFWELKVCTMRESSDSFFPSVYTLPTHAPGCCRVLIIAGYALVQRWASCVRYLTTERAGRKRDKLQMRANNFALIANIFLLVAIRSKWCLNGSQSLEVPQPRVFHCMQFVLKIGIVMMKLQVERYNQSENGKQVWKFCTVTLRHKLAFSFSGKKTG